MTLLRSVDAYVNRSILGGAPRLRALWNEKIVRSFYFVAWLRQRGSRARQTAWIRRVGEKGKEAGRRPRRRRGARDGTRTRTPCERWRILSPLRLPISPPGPARDYVGALERRRAPHREPCHWRRSGGAIRSRTGLDGFANPPRHLETHRHMHVTPFGSVQKQRTESTSGNEKSGRSCPNARLWRCGYCRQTRREAWPTTSTPALREDQRHLPCLAVHQRFHRHARQRDPPPSPASPRCPF